MLQRSIFDTIKKYCQDKSYTGRAWSIWMCANLFVFFQFFLQLSGGVIANDLISSFHTNALGVAILAGSYYYVYVALQMPAGALIRRFGPRRLLSWGALVCSLGCLLFATTQSIFIAEMGRILMGGGTAFAFVGSMYLAHEWFPVEQFSMMVGVAETLGMLGIVFGESLLAKALHYKSWQYVMLIAALIAFILSLLCYLIIQDTPRGNLSLSRERTQLSWWQHLKPVLAKPAIWANGLYTGCIYTITTVFFALWGIPYFTTVDHLSVDDAAWACSLVFIGAAIGSPIWGWVYVRFKYRKLLLVFGALGSLLLMLAVLYLNHLPFISLSIILVLLGMCACVYVVNYTIAGELVAASQHSVSIGVVNTLALMTAPLLQSIVGALLFWFAKQHLELHGHIFYSIADYHYSLIVIPITLLFALVLTIWIPERLR